MSYYLQWISDNTLKFRLRPGRGVWNADANVFEQALKRDSKGSTRYGLTKKNCDHGDVNTKAKDKT